MVERSKNPTGTQPLKGAGVYTTERWAFAHIFFGEVAAYLRPPKKPQDEGPAVGLQFKIGGRHPAYINLTALTEPEILALREVTNAAIDMALPEIRRRDKVANDDFEREDGGVYSRSYRAVPRIAYRQGAFREYSKSLRERLEELPVIDGGQSEWDSYAERQGLRYPGGYSPQPDEEGSSEPERDSSPVKPDDAFETHWSKRPPSE